MIDKTPNDKIQKLLIEASNLHKNGRLEELEKIELRDTILDGAELDEVKRIEIILNI